LATGKITAAQIHALFYAITASEKFQVQDAEIGLAAAEEGLALYPDDPLLQTNQLALLLQANRHAEALPLLTAKLAQPYVEPGLQALDLNNAAWSILLLFQEGRLDGTGSSLAQGKEYAEWAFAMLPWMAPVEGTWAAYLIEIGEAEAGIVHALAAAKHQEIADHRATNLAHAAVGHYRLGQHDQALSLLAQAQALAPEGRQVRWAMGIVDGKAAVV
jgi:tetratricopeptide (TPR) repeat protein